MTVYFVSEIEWHDTGPMQRYLQAVGASKQKYGGNYLVQGGNPQLIEGDRAVSRMVITAFESKEQAMAWWNSPEYAAARKIREPVTTARVLLVEGADTKLMAG